METTFKFTLFVLFIAILCSDFTSSDTDNDQIASGFTNFAIKMYQEVAKENEDNIIYSPLSIETALLLLFMGAKGNTANEISIAFELYPKSRTAIAKAYSSLLNSNDDQHYTIANKIYVAEDFTINPAFNEIAEDTFGSETENLDFTDAAEAAAEINNWVECQTNDKIKDFFNPTAFSSDTRMVIVNAIYFKGEWLHQFDADNTASLPFWNSGTDSVQVDTMSIMSTFKVGSYPELGLQAVELSYKDSDVTMMILLPLTRTGLADLENDLTNINVFELSDEMASSKIKLWMPKFLIETELDLNEFLQMLGITTMFTDDAQFNDLLDTPESLKVSKAVHKAYIAVDENGTEAAAATGITISTTSVVLDPEEVHIDHPFIYIIKDKKSILFMGRINNL